MALSIVGAGFGRTGTLSLKNALETLGFGPCYHMMVVGQHPGHVELWNAAADGDVDGFDEIFSGYQSAVDWPACRYWRELASAYPEARVLLTVRDPESWYDSVHQTLYQFMTREIPADAPAAMVAQVAMARRIVLEQTFDGRFDDRRHAIGVFECHSDEVRRSIPADRLLEFEARQGWEPLCRFLDVALPDEPYPRTNSRQEILSTHGAPGAGRS